MHFSKCAQFGAHAESGDREVENERWHLQEHMALDFKELAIQLGILGVPEGQKH